MEHALITRHSLAARLQQRDAKWLPSCRSAGSLHLLGAERGRRERAGEPGHGRAELGRPQSGRRGRLPGGEGLRSFVGGRRGLDVYHVRARPGPDRTAAHGRFLRHVPGGLLVHHAAVDPLDTGVLERNVWRNRYLSPWPWRWWLTALLTWWFLAFAALPGTIIVAWWHAPLFAIRCSDQRWLDRIEAFFLVPFFVAWMTAVLRPMRLYGIATCFSQGWSARNSKIEIITG